MAFTSRGAHGTSRTQTALAEINITPLVDVVLVLLLIFMLTAPVLQSGIEVAIPHTRSTATLTEERVVVTIDKGQNVYLQASGADRQVNVADLGAQVRAVSAKNAAAAKMVYVRADERVPFGAFASVMSALKQGGVTNISVVTQPFEK